MSTNRGRCSGQWSRGLRSAINNASWSGVQSWSASDNGEGLDTRLNFDPDVIGGTSTHAASPQVMMVRRLRPDADDSLVTMMRIVTIAVMSWKFRVQPLDEGVVRGETPFFPGLGMTYWA